MVDAHIKSEEKETLHVPPRAEMFKELVLSLCTLPRRNWGTAEWRGTVQDCVRRRETEALRLALLRTEVFKKSFR